MSSALEKLREKKRNANVPLVNAPQDIQGNYYGNLGRTAVGQGFLLGFGDELEAGFSAAMSRFSDDPKTYKEIRDGVRQQLKQFQAQNPKTAITSEIVGGLIPTVAMMIATPFTGGSSGAAATANAGRVMGVAKRALNAAPVSAGAGLGYSEADLTEGNVGGAVLDTAIGGLAGVVGSEGLRQAAKAAGGSYKSFNTFIRNKYGNEYVGPVSEYLNKLRSRTGKSIEETIEDIKNGGVMAEDDSLVASLRNIAAEGGEASGDIKRAASARADETMQQAERSVRNALAPDIDDTNVLRAVSGQSDELKLAQGARYEQIYADAPDVPKSLSDRIVGMMNVNPDVRKMFYEDFLSARLTNPNLKPLFTMIKNEDGSERMKLLRNITLKDAEDFRRNLQETASMIFESPSKRNAPGFNYIEAEKAVRAQIDKASPALKSVRSDFAGREAVDAAIKKGRSMAGKSPDDIQVAMDSLSPEELKGFRAGMQMSINKRMSDKGGTYSAQAGGLEVSNRTPNQVMQTILPEDQADDVIADLARAGRAAQNNVKVKPAGAAITQFTEAAGGEKSAVGAAANASRAAQGDIFAAANLVTDLISTKQLGLNDQQTQKVVEILFSKDPDLVRSALTDTTKMGELNRKISQVAQAVVQLSDNVVKRQSQGLIDSL